MDAGIGQVRPDERKIRQVIHNLLSNAIKFTPEGRGGIELAAAPKDDAVELSVSDTGVGIAPEDQEKVFQECRQVGTAEKKAEGTGPGLTLCRKFVELHGGRIWVKSQLMHQAQKGRQWYFGMKGHFGMDNQSKLIHSVEVTPAHIHDSHWLLHGAERRVWGDSAHAGQAAVLRVCAPDARDFIHRRATTPELRATNRWKSRIRARVEHPIGVIKRVFGFKKVRYRGLHKNRHRLVVASALANLFMMRKRLLRLQAA